MKIEAQLLLKMQETFLIYKSEIETTNMTKLTKKTYIDNVEKFIRWLSDDFTPGEKSKKR